MNMPHMVNEITRDEGVKLKPYRCTAGKLTIGIGRNIEDNGISNLEAQFMLQNDIEATMHELDAKLTWWRRMHEEAQRGLVNMAFNMGVPRLLKFEKMLHALKSDLYLLAADEALESKWAQQVGSRAHRIAEQFRGE